MVVANFKRHINTLMEGLNKTAQMLRIACPLAEILTRDIPNTKLEN
jgi:hypothetical protein